jgi:hypothetical protein
MNKQAGAAIGHGGEFDQPLQTHCGVIFRHDIAQIGHLLLEESSIRRFLLALSAFSHDMLLQQQLA